MLSERSGPEILSCLRWSQSCFHVGGISINFTSLVLLVFFFFSFFSEPNIIKGLSFTNLILINLNGIYSFFECDCVCVCICVVCLSVCSVFVCMCMCV